MCYTIYMIIKSLSLQNFRNHARTNITLSPGTNILVGNNAQGKTNLLEAIYLSCVGRGWRTPRDRDMIQFDAPHAHVRTTARKKFGDITIDITLQPKPDTRTGVIKSIKINDTPIAKTSALLGTINCIFFSPDELRLIKDAPGDRRRFMDIDISQIDRQYVHSLVRYNKILQQRNALLKTMRGTPESDDLRTLDIWDIQLAKAGQYIIDRRLSFIGQLSPHVKRTHSQLTNTAEQINIIYISIDTINTAPVSSSLASALTASRDRDLRLRTTTVGPHRDDLKITIDGRDVRTFASQGQQRTVALSLKLAELDLFRELTGETPILLLDDVFSELDAVRQSALLASIKNVQSLITTTDADAANSTCTPDTQKNVPRGTSLRPKIFKIQNGIIEATISKIHFAK